MVCSEVKRLINLVNKIKIINQFLWCNCDRKLIIENEWLADRFPGHQLPVFAEANTTQ